MSFTVYIIMLCITSGLMLAITVHFPDLIESEINEVIVSFMAGVFWPITLSALIWTIIIHIIKEHSKPTDEQ